MQWPMLVPHLFTIILAIIAMWWSMKNTVFRFVATSRPSIVLMLFLRFLSIMQILTMLSYLYNQINFICEYAVVGVNLSEPSLYSWLAHEYLNLLAHIIFALSVGVYMAHYTHLEREKYRAEKYE